MVCKVLGDLKGQEHNTAKGTVWNQPSSGHGKDWVITISANHRLRDNRYGFWDMPCILYIQGYFPGFTLYASNTLGFGYRGLSCQRAQSWWKQLQLAEQNAQVKGSAKFWRLQKGGRMASKGRSVSFFHVALTGSFLYVDRPQRKNAV